MVFAGSGDRQHVATEQEVQGNGLMGFESAVSGEVVLPLREIGMWQKGRGSTLGEFEKREP